MNYCFTDFFWLLSLFYTLLVNCLYKSSYLICMYVGWIETSWELFIDNLDSVKSCKILLIFLCRFLTTFNMCNISGASLVITYNWFEPETKPHSQVKLANVSMTAHMFQIYHFFGIYYCHFFGIQYCHIFGIYYCHIFGI